MSMSRSDKENVVSFLTEEFNNNEAFVICNYRGLKVSEIELLRNEASENNIKVKVIKNRLAKIALDNSNKEGLSFNDTNLLVWGKNAISISKLVFKFKNQYEAMDVKSGFIEGSVVDVTVVEAFSKLPDREELLGMLASVWMAPIRNFTIGLNQLKEQKEA